MKAVERACELVELLGCGEVVDGVMDVIARDSNPTVVRLETERINALLGTDVPESEMRRILENLDFQLEGDRIIVPSWRGDVEHYSDIAEEVARFYGYNRIPVTLMRGAAIRGGYTPVQQAERTVGAACRTCGYNEIITYSFISPAYYDKINLPANSPLRDSLKILNPLGEDTSIMCLCFPGQNQGQSRVLLPDILPQERGDVVFGDGVEHLGEPIGVKAVEISLRQRDGDIFKGVQGTEHLTEAGLAHPLVKVLVDSLLGQALCLLQNGGGHCPGFPAVAAGVEIGHTGHHLEGASKAAVNQSLVVQPKIQGAGIPQQDVTGHGRYAHPD